MAGSAGLVMCEREFILKILGGMIMMKKKGTFSMGRALILRIYGRHLQKPAGVIKLHFNKLVHHTGGLLSLAFCSDREAAMLVWGTQDDHEITTIHKRFKTSF